MADAQHDSAAYLVPTVAVCAPHSEMLRILGDGAATLRARTGRKFMLGLDVDGGVSVLRAVRDDGYHAAFTLLPGPDAPRFVRADGERIGGEASPEELATLWFRYRVEDAVEAFVNGQNEEAA